MSQSIPVDLSEQDITPKRVAGIAQLADDDPELIRELLDGEFRWFANVVSYRYLDPRPEDWYPVPDHAMDWHRHLTEEAYSPMILSGRKHTKTTWVLCELLYNLQYIDHFRALYWCNNVENQLTSRMNELEDMIDANLWLDNLHKGKPDNQNNVPAGVKEKNFPNGSVLYGTAVGAGSEGDHVNMVLGDDPLKEMGDISDEDILSYYKNVIVPMADASDQSAIVGTRKRPKDIYHLIQEMTADMDAYDLAGYELIEYPAIKEPWEDKYGDGPNVRADLEYATKTAPKLADMLDVPGDEVSILWPEGRGVDFLEGKAGRMGPNSFKREFCMVFTHVEGAIIKRQLIDGPPMSLDSAPPENREQLEAMDVTPERITIGIDPAVVEGSDNNAWVVLCRDTDGYRYPLHVEYDDGLSPSYIRETTVDLFERWDPAKIVWESNGWQEWLAEEQVQFPDYLPMEMAGTGKRKHSWQSGVPAIADAVESGQFRFYRDSDGTEALIDALCQLRLDDNDHLAGHTPDVVMALYMAEKGMAMGRVESSRRSMRGGSRKESESERETRRTLRGNPVGEQLLDQRDGLR